MGSSFCDPTREICPFGAPIDPTLGLVNNIYQQVSGVAGPVKAPPAGLTPIPPPPRIGGTYVGPTTQFIEPVSTMQTLRQAPGVVVSLPPIPLPGGGGINFPSINFNPFQQPQRQPPLLPGRIPPGPQVVVPGGGGCPTGPSICCPKGHHPDKKFGVKCVRNRRMNPLNHRALRRAIRRMDGFEGIAKKMGYTKKKRR